MIIPKSIMKWGIVVTFALLFVFTGSYAQKNKSGFKLQQPHREKHRSGKTGFVGRDPGKKRQKVKFIKPKQGRKKSKALFLPANKIRKPKRRVKFLAVEKSPQSKNTRAPKRVNDKQMVLPKMRGDKKRNKTTKYGFMGVNPGMSANKVREKHNSDIQYRTYYKFNKKGGLDKTSGKKRDQQ